jgi:hypothetical protein
MASKYWARTRTLNVSMWWKLEELEEMLEQAQRKIKN